MDPLDNTQMVKKLPLVIYHDHCIDGFASAWCFYRYNPVGYEFMAGRYQDKDFEKQFEFGMFHDRIIFLVDFSYPETLMKRILSVSDQMIVLDHHKTALEMLGELPPYNNLNTAHCTLDRSGCGICWKYLNGDDPMPLVLKNIQDRDLWQFKLEHTKEICEVLQSIPGLDYKNIGEFIMESSYDNLIIAGGALLMAKALRINIGLQRASWYTDKDGNDYWSLNYTSDISELGNELCKQRSKDGQLPTYADIWYLNNGVIKHSLRSIGEFDTTKISLEYGGGGHANASGYSIDTNVYDDPDAPKRAIDILNKES